MKLPFDWKIEQKGATSHLIGSPHALNVNTTIYTRDLFRYINDKMLAAVEEIHGFGGLDEFVETVASERQMPIMGLLTSKESSAFYKQYSTNLNPVGDAVVAFKNADANALKTLYLARRQEVKDAPPLEKIHSTILQRSIKMLNKAPSIIVVDVAHLLLEPSLITLYSQQKELQIEPIQPQ